MRKISRCRNYDVVTCLLTFSGNSTVAPTEVEFSGIVRSMSNIALIVSSNREFPVGTAVSIHLDGRVRTGSVQQCAPHNRRYLLWLELPYVQASVN